MLRIVTAALLAILAYPAMAAPKQPPAGVPDPLFASNEVLEVTIRAPFAALMRDRPDEEDMPAELTYDDAELGEVVLEIGVRTRGRFRRQKDICQFAPLRLNFRKGDTGKTVFSNIDKIKMVTHCRNRSDRYSQVVLREYLAYRIFNVITDRSFRVRLLQVNYVDADPEQRSRTNFAFLVEHRDQLAKRIGGKVLDVKKTSVASLDGAHMNLGSVFQYLIGNTDFSPIRAPEDKSCCHNYVLLAPENGPLLSVPYDLDMSGFVNAAHSAHNPRFRLRDVRSRLYRGRCVNNAYLDESLQTYRDRRSDIYGLVNGLQQLSKSTRKKLTRYIDDFYQTIDDERRVDSRIRNRCL